MNPVNINTITFFCEALYAVTNESYLQEVPLRECTFETEKIGPDEFGYTETHTFVSYECNCGEIHTVELK